MSQSKSSNAILQLHGGHRRYSHTSIRQEGYPSFDRDSTIVTENECRLISERVREVRFKWKFFLDVIMLRLA